ncbi:MAG: hypothetical protein OP8BY_1234 [Candidatus Saccharicenans subterraneus]|uniref:Tryptophan-rich sensory protein n=1 Tax=Candidatus Saccharicenans subterraneus TaxID=2508984 RepID=A0A3E2BPJ1_9BACT|nr:MAG: hypothetical protein OP8BY_1234 [Candidatus Saccharicenans subterraneum]
MEENQAFLRGQRPEIRKRTAGNWLAWLNLAGFLGMVVVNYLANALPINNLNTGQLSDKYPNLFVPAGFTFSIWGVIYLLLAVFVFFSLKQAITGREVFPAFKTIGLLFFLTCLANAGWIFAWHYEQLLLSLLIMLTLLALLVIIYQRLSRRPYEEKQHDRFPARLPFSIYLAWISVATVANTTAVLVGFKWDRFGLSEQFWTIVVLALITVLTLVFMLKKKDLLFGLTAIWALSGILYKRVQDTAAADRAVETAIVAALFIILLALILRVVVRQAGKTV